MASIQAPHDVYMHAAQLLDQGQIKDAYMCFLSVVELSTKQLYGVKFVHHTVVSTPDLYEVSLSMIRSSLSHLDDIVVKRSLASSLHYEPSPPPLPKSTVVMSPPTPSQDYHLLFQSKILPSTPSSYTNTTGVNKTKPAIPPKPKTLPPLAPSTSSSSKTATASSLPSTTTGTIYSTKAPIGSPSPSSAAEKKNRGRGNSVSFADDTNHNTSSIDDDGDNSMNKNCRGNMIDDDDDEDDDDDDDDYEDDEEVIVDFDHGSAFTTTPMRRNQSQPDILRAHTLSDPRPSFCIERDDPQRKSLDISHHQQHLYEYELNPVDVLADSVIDPSILVPAQTNPGDSLTPPSSSTQTSDYVPLIPMPPLLTTHRLLQHQLTDLEASLNECRAKKRAMALLVETRNSSISMTRSNGKLEKDMDERILQRSTSVAQTRATLNKVRTLYMKAATVPNVMQFPPYLTAYQLTLIESAIFRNIPKDAFLTHSPRRPHARIVSSTDFFNYTTRIIEHSILLPQEASRRAEMINRWIKVATKCLLLNNYQTLKAIVSALGTPPVQRLRRTWDCIPKKRMTRLELLNALMSESDNYGRYREHMGLLETSSSSSSLTYDPSQSKKQQQHWTTPVVPFLGVFIHDMTYLFAATKPGTQPQNDIRVQDAMACFTDFQHAPVYPPVPPTSYIKASQPKKHSFRPTASIIANALQRTSASVMQRSSHMALLFGASTSLMMDEGGGDDGDPRREMELEQQLITQYLLMRPWVNEKIVDELSLLREPPKPRSGSSPGSRSHSGSGTSGVSSYPSSIFSNTSSFARLNSTSSSLTSWEDDTYDEEEEDDDDDEDEDEDYVDEGTEQQRQRRKSVYSNVEEDDFRNKQQHPMMMMPISPTATTKATHYHHHHPLRTAHSFSAEPAATSSLAETTTTATATTATATTTTATATTATKGGPSSSSNTPPGSSKMDEHGAFSLVGHLRSLSLPASDHPIAFRKRS